MLRRTVISVEP